MHALLATLLFAVISSTAAAAERTVDRLQREARGFYLLWGEGRPGADEIMRLPFIRGGQIVVQWGDVETGPGKYDFSAVDSALARFAASGRWTTIQINGNIKPAWLFTQVPYVREQFDEQVRNREGTLMFWHPRFREAHLAMLAAFARHLRSSPHQSRLLGLRLNFNPVGTEHFNFPEQYRTPDKWTVPPGVDRATVAAFTPELQKTYEGEVVTTYERLFSDWTTVFVRNNIGDELRARYAAHFKNGRLAFFHTSSEAEPRAAGIERQYGAFHDFCRSGLTVGYAEPWASAWGEHGGILDSRWCSPPQWNYWTLLFNLHCGVSFIGEYYTNLYFATTGRHGRTAVPPDSAEPREFMAAYAWGAEYIGLHNRPAESPGAWVAFRDNKAAKAVNPKVPAPRRQLNRFAGDYNWLAERVGDDRSEGVGPIGPDEQRYGAFARRYPAGASARVRLDPKFVASLAGDATVRIIALNGAPAEARIGARAFQLPASDARWRTTEFRVPAASLRENAGFNLEVRAGAQPLTLHMVEVRRGPAP
ncbi:MAG: beta-galactosidase [Opitutaceae bacterium]|nr:beta-galactosidase [Opitutaceae bacterium]